MKKKIFLFLFIILIVGFISFFGIRFIMDSDVPNDEDKGEIAKREPLAGKLIKGDIYEYIKDDNYDYSDINIKENDMYFLDYEKNKYTLKKQNIYSGKIENIADKTVDKKTYCMFLNHDKKIKCENDKKVTYYSENFEQIRQFESEDVYKYVPYQDSFLIYEINKIDKDKVIFNGFVYNDDNTYVIYTHINLNKLIIYDIKNKKIYEEFYTQFTYNENGIIIFKYSDITVYKIDGKIEHFNYKPTIIDDTYMWNVNENLTMTVNYIDKYKKIFIENLKDKTIDVIDLGDLKLDYVRNVYVENNYVYLIEEGKTSLNIYVVDIINHKFIKREKYEKNLNREIEEKIAKLKKDYGINILIKDQTQINFADFQAEYVEDNLPLISYIDKILDVAKRFNKEFFDTFYEGKMAGINFYLTGSLTPKYQSQYSYPAAYSLSYDDKHAIVLDVNQFSIEDNICHELSHTLENNINNRIDGKYNIYSEWNSYNLSNYLYNNSYVTEQSDKYTINGESDKGNAYFVNSYSKTFPTEDRAEVFSYICSKNKDLLKYEKIVAKAKYMKKEILEYYPMLANASIFEIIE